MTLRHYAPTPSPSIAVGESVQGIFSIDKIMFLLPDDDDDDNLVEVLISINILNTWLMISTNHHCREKLDVDHCWTCQVFLKRFDLPWE